LVNRVGQSGLRVLVFRVLISRVEVERFARFARFKRIVFQHFRAFGFLQNFLDDSFLTESFNKSKKEKKALLKRRC